MRLAVLFLLTLFCTGASAQVHTRFDPIILDMDGDGLDLGGIVTTELLSGATATLRWTTANAEDCFLVLDASTLEASGHELRDAGGTILSGPVLVQGGLRLRDAQGNLQSAASGLDLLLLLDSTADGQLDASDQFWVHLWLFMDYNNDGRLVGPELHRPETVLLSGGPTLVGPPTVDPWGNLRRDGSWQRDGLPVLLSYVELVELSVAIETASWGELKSGYRP